MSTIFGGSQEDSLFRLENVYNLLNNIILHQNELTCLEHRRTILKEQILAEVMTYVEMIAELDDMRTQQTQEALHS